LRIEPVAQGKHLKVGDTTLVPVQPGWLRLAGDA